MDKIELSTTERQAVPYWRLHHPHPRGQRTMAARYLQSHGLVPEDLWRRCAKTASTHGQRCPCRGASASGLPTARVLKRPGGSVPPPGSAEAALRIAQRTGLARSPPQVRQCLKALGMHPRTVGQIPAKADVTAHEDVKTEPLDPRLDAAKAGQRLVCFLEAAHFVCAPCLGVVWCLARLCVKAPRGRPRFNGLAALHATTPALFTVQYLPSITAETVCA